MPCNVVMIFGWCAAVANSILAFNIIKCLGVAYLFYLAVRQWRTATVDIREQVGKAMDGGRVALVVRGFLRRAHRIAVAHVSIDAPVLSASARSSRP